MTVRADWRAQKERSSKFMLHLMMWFAVRWPRFLVRISLYPIVLYFLASGGAAKRASRDYLQRVFGRSVTWLDHWRHFFAFASCTLDRFYLLRASAPALRVERNRPPEVTALVKRSTGCMLFVAHFGSTEAMRVTGVNQAQLPISILLDRQHGRMLMSLLEELNPDMAQNVIDASERGPKLVLNLKEVLQRGRMVGIMADRAALTERAVTVDFLGGRARLPVGPWQLAAALHVPVILGFGWFEGGNRYRVQFEVFAEKIELQRPRQQAVTVYAQRYAQRLEHYVRLAPYNWFNFYDYWQVSPGHNFTDDSANNSTDKSGNDTATH
jgi:predicted LPLAT superfamily acyltransferase